MKTLIKMNLKTHKLSNKSTSMIYGISLAFCILISVVMESQIKAGTALALNRQGSRYIIEPGWEQPYMTLRQLKKFIRVRNLEKEIKYTLIFDDRYLHLAESGYSRNITLLQDGKLKTESTNIFSLGPSYSKISASFLNVYKSKHPQVSQTGLSISELMYTREFDSYVLMSSSSEEELNLDCSDPKSKFLVKYYKKPRYFYNEVRCLSSFSSIAGLNMTSKSIMSTNNDVAVNLITYLHLGRLNINHINYLQIKKVFIDIVSKDPKRIEEVKMSLSTKRHKELLSFIEKGQLYDDEDPQNMILRVVQGGLVFLCMVLNIFSLFTSIVTKVIQQRKEMGMLRSLGITACRIASIYFYESLLVIFMGGLIGLVIGTFLGWLSGVQSVIWTNSIFIFEVPWYLILVIGILSLLSAFVGAFLPALSLTKGNLSSKLKDKR